MLNPISNNSPQQKQVLSFVQQSGATGITTQEIIRLMGVTPGGASALTCQLVKSGQIVRVRPGLYVALGVPAKADEPAPVARKRNVSVTQKVVEALEGAGRVGMMSGDLSKVVGSAIPVWWNGQGKKDGRITRVGRGHYVLTSHLEAGEQKGLPQIPTHIVAEASREKREQNPDGVVRWTRSRMVAATEEWFRLTGEKFVEEEGEMEIIATKAASLWWEYPLRFDALSAVQHVMDTPELRGEVRYRKISSLACLRHSRDGKSLLQLMSEKMQGIKEMMEEGAKVPEPIKIVERVPIPLKESLQALPLVERVQLIWGVLGEEIPTLFSFLGSLQAAPQRLQFAPRPPQPVATPAPDSPKRARIAFITLADRQQVDKVRSRVGDVIDIDHINIRDSKPTQFSGHLVAVIMDTSKPGLNTLRNQAMAHAKNTGCAVIKCENFKGMEYEAIELADKIRAEVSRKNGTRNGAPQNAQMN